MTARIDLADLQLGPELDRGGQGRVFPVLRRTDGQQRPLVYKQYDPELTSALDAAALDQLADLPGRNPEDADWLRERTAWPQILVEDEGRVTGFLMQRIPEDFRFAFQSSPGATSARFCQYAFLLNSDAYVQSSGLVVTDRDRFLLLADVAAALGRFHRLGVAVGDLSPKNMLFASDGSHRTFFIDCDAVRLGVATVLPQANTPDWEPPSGEELGTAATDDYKFGLLAIRLFARSQTSHDAEVIGGFSAYLRYLAKASQDLDPLRRPPAEAWLEALQEAASEIDRPRSTTVNVPRIPPGGPQLSPARPQRNRAGLVVLAAAVAAVLIGGGIAAYDNLAQPATISTATVGNPDDEGSQDPGLAPVSPATVPATSPSPSPPSPSPSSSIGVVSIDSSIIDDPRAQQVASMFNTYFTAISDQDYPAVLAEYDPNGSLNPNDSQEVQGFENGIATSSDSDVVLNGLAPSGTGPATTADITFQSTQEAGYGPGDDPDETCTDWTLTYTLTYTDGNYLIFSSTGTDTGC